jgi:hypothetical protein
MTKPAPAAVVFSAVLRSFQTGANSRAISFLLKSQLSDGSWSAFRGDSEGSWITALALCTLNLTGDFDAARDKAVRWLVAERGREDHWLWPWKFRTLDRNVQFDPDKYSWPWISNSTSWVIPTAFSVVAIKQFTVCNRRSEASEKRIQLGVEMLLDRVCIGGGWNSGNNVVYGVALRPHVEATAIAGSGPELRRVLEKDRRIASRRLEDVPNRR